MQIFEKDSDIYKGFKAEMPHLYDSHFSYRLLIRLRDYSIHVGYPIDKISVQEITAAPNNLYETEIKYVKEHLLSNGTIKSKLGKDFGNESDEIDVLPHIRSCYTALFLYHLSSLLLSIRLLLFFVYVEHIRKKNL